MGGKAHRRYAKPARAGRNVHGSHPWRLALLKARKEGRKAYLARIRGE